MSTTITYQILFEVKVLHHYFLNRGERAFDKMTVEEKANAMMFFDAREIFDIVPTGECSRILDAYRCIFKKTSQGIIVGLRAEPEGPPPFKFKPFHELADDLAFTFLIYLKDFQFMNYTALPLSGNSGNTYIFRNSTGASPKKFPSLSAFAPLFKGGSEYLPGDMLSDNPSGPAKLFIARVRTNKNTSTTDWTTEKKSDGFPMSYANINDRYPVVRGILSYHVNVAGKEPVAEVRTATGTIISPKITLLAGDFRTLQVDLREFPDGFYIMHIHTEDNSYQDDISFYLMQERVSPFGIIHLTVKSDDSPYDMLDAQDHLQSPSYELRFRNRATHWRYIGKRFNATSVTDDPLPLTRYGIIENVSVKDKDGLTVDDLPNPGITMIKTEAMTVPGEKKFYSEIHIH